MAELIDPRFLPAAGPTVPGEGFGTPPQRMTPEQMENQVRVLQSNLFRALLPDTDPLHLNMIPEDQDRTEQLLMAWSFYEPDLVLQVHGELTTQFGLDPVAGDVTLDAGLAAAFNQILSTAEQRSEETRTTVEGTTTVDREGETVSERETTVSETRFVELPTPEEFQNDFITGLSAFTLGLRKQGLITRDAADWMLDNPDFFYFRYLDDLSARIDAGEDIWREVNVDGEPIFLGARDAGTEEIESSGINRERILTEVIANEREQIEQEVIRDITSTGTIETTEQQQQVDAEIDRRIEERTTTLINEAIQFFGTETIITTEQVFSRPELNPNILKISPETFLTSQFPAQSVEQIAAGRRGTEQGRRATAQGIAPSAPRRVGGV